MPGCSDPVLIGANQTLHGYCFDPLQGDQVSLGRCSLGPWEGPEECDWVVASFWLNDGGNLWFGDQKGILSPVKRFRQLSLRASCERETVLDRILGFTYLCKK